MEYADLRGLFMLLGLAGMVYTIVRLFANKDATFEEHLSPVLKAKGFKLLYSEQYRPKFMEEPFPQRDEDFTVNYLSAGKGMVVQHGHAVYKLVGFRDQLGTTHEVLAGIRFKGFFNRKKVIRIEWKPSLDSFTADSLKRPHQNQRAAPG
jgi:hypothetical protein